MADDIPFDKNLDLAPDTVDAVMPGASSIPAPDAGHSRMAIARRAGIPLDMKRFDEISREVPVIANVRPSGAFLMEDFF